MAMTAGQFLALMEPGLDKIWHDAEATPPTQYSSIFNVGSLDELFREEAKMTGFGALQEQAEGAPLTYDEAIAPITKRYDYVVHALGYKVTDKLIRNEKYGEVRKFEADLRAAAEDDVELFAFAMLNNATSATEFSGFDGLALASTAHTRMDGGATQSNRPSSLGSLSLANLKSAVIQFRKWKTERGRPAVYKPKTLIIPPDLEMDAIEILGSSDKPQLGTVGSAGDDRNAINWVGRFGLNYKVVDYLTSTTFWALVGDKHDLNILWRFRPETGSEVDFDTETIKRKVRQGFARGFGEWKGFYLGNT